MRALEQLQHWRRIGVDPHRLTAADGNGDRNGAETAIVHAAASPAAPADPTALALRLQMRLERNRFGAYFVRESAHTLSSVYGRQPLDAILRHSVAPLQRFAGSFPDANPAPERLLFFDTETTGLAGGTGTLIVLAGVGRIDGNRLRIRQFMLLDPRDEPAFLAAILDEIMQCDAVVSFNGKRFDWPLLETRLTLARFDRVTDALDHLDLLQPARTLYRQLLPSCRLSMLEAHLLGMQRVDDIPGAEVPWRYRTLLTHAAVDLFEPVLAHNESDILALVALTAHLAQRFGAAERGELDVFPSPRPLLALADAWRRRGELRRALRLLEGVVRHWSPQANHSDWQQAVFALAAMEKRLRMLDRAGDRWRQLLDAAFPLNVKACIELAKYYEHHRKDSVAALTVTERALQQLLPFYQRFPDQYGDLWRQLRQRRQRLQRRGGDRGASAIPLLPLP